MKSILLITWANIKRRKVQTFLVTICIALTAMLFATLIGVYQGMEEPFDKLQDNLQASHIIMNFDQNIHDPVAYTKWFEEQPEFEKITPPRIAKNVMKRFIFNGAEIASRTRLIEHPGNSKGQDQVIIFNGTEKDFPGPGEIWAPNHWLNKEELSVGDTIYAPTDDGLFPLVISAFIVEPHFSNGLSGMTHAFVGPGGLSMMYPVSQLSGVQLGIRLKDPTNAEAVWARFSRVFQFDGFCMRYDVFKRIFQVLYQFIGSLLSAFSILGILITIIITITVVNSAIRSDYKMIGMLKSQGFTNWNVNMVYLVQFIMITLIAVPLGLVGGYFMVQLIFKSLISAIGAVNFEVSLLGPAIVTFFTFLVGILLITYLTAKKASSISPVTAIRYGGPPPKSFKPSKSRFFSLRPSSYLPMFLGWRFLLSNKKRSLTLFIGLLFVIIVQNFYLNASGSAFNLADNRPGWGIGNADLRVTKGINFDAFDEEDAFFEKMKEDDRVDHIVPVGVYVTNLPGTENVAPRFIAGFVFDDDPAVLGLTVLEGRHPVFEDEVSLGITSSKNLDKTVGDSLSVFMEGQLVNFIITGLHQTIDDLGEGFRIRLDGIQEHNPLYKLNRYNILLERGEDVNAFEDDLLKTYGGAYKIRRTAEMEDVLSGILVNLRDVIFLVSLLFLAVLIVTVFNDTVLSIRENQRNLGIYKAIGMTPRQLQIALLFKAILIAVLALLIGIPFAAKFLGPGLSLLTADVGLVEVPYVHQWSSSLLVIPIILVLTIGSVWLASRGVLQVKPRVLVRE